MTKQLCRYAFTLHGDDLKEKVKPIIETLGTTCRRWIFQLEEGRESGKAHLQGRLSFKQPRRLGECQKVIQGAHFSPEHDEEAGNFYCMKDDTRVDGPWSDKDTKQGPVPWDLERITDWKPWQQAIFDSLGTQDDRIVNVLVDTVGGIGKSKVLKWALWKRLAKMVPAVGDAKDIIQAVCSMGASPAYLIDLPRTGESEIHMRSIWKAVEQVKNGVVIDLRYKYTQLIMGSPVVWVFTNEEPNLSLLSTDRWRFWSVKDDRLVRRRILIEG